MSRKTRAAGYLAVWFGGATLALVVGWEPARWAFTGLVLALCAGVSYSLWLRGPGGFLPRAAPPAPVWASVTELATYLFVFGAALWSAAWIVAATMAVLVVEWQLIYGAHSRAHAAYLRECEVRDAEAAALVARLNEALRAGESMKKGIGV